MHNLSIDKAHINIDFPSDIDELSDDQFQFYCQLILSYISGEISVDQFKVRFFMKLADVRMSWKYFFLSEAKRDLIRSQLLHLSETIETFFVEYEKEGKPVKAFQLNTVRNFVPKLCKTLHGPVDGFQDLTFCEYRMAYTWFKAYSESNNESYLDQLIAILYRPRKPFLCIRKYFPGYDGQRRIPFTAKSDPQLLNNRLKRIEKLPTHIKYAIFLYFSGCEDFLRTGSPEVDGTKIDLSIIYKKQGSNEQDSELKDIGLLGILYNLSESKVFGSIEQTDSQMLWDVMLRLYQVVKQNKDLERRHGTGS